MFQCKAENLKFADSSVVKPGQLTAYLKAVIAGLDLGSPGGCCCCSWRKGSSGGCCTNKVFQLMRSLGAGGWGL